MVAHEEAKELLRKLEEERASLSKNQLKKQRKKLSKLFHKAQPCQPSDGNTAGVAGEAAPQKALELKHQLQTQRSHLSRNQLKKQRKKLSKLFNKASQGAAGLQGPKQPEDDEVSASLYTGVPTEQLPTVTSPAAKRRKLNSHEQPPVHSNLSMGPPSKHHHQNASASGAISHAAPSSTLAYPPPAAPTAADASISAACSTGAAWTASQPTLMQLPSSTQQAPHHHQQQQQHSSQCRMDLSLQAGLILHQLMSADAAGSNADELTCCAGPDPASQQQVQHSDQQQEEEEDQQQEDQQQEDEGQQGSKRSRKTPYMYGNYHRYYGYRLGADMESDPRIQVMQPQWFTGRRVLDVGCNEGLLTLALATKYGCASVLGLDIDAALVHKAARNLREGRAQATAKLQQPGLPDRQGQLQSLRARVKALAKVHFRQEDFLTSYTKKTSVDTLCCFSVTKWVHLIHGDDGIIRLFGKFWRTLVPGGYLVLEPQMWKSYKNAAKQQDSRGEVVYHPLDKLKMKPEGFREYLTRRLGFRMVADVVVDKEACVQGFDRPLWVLQKPE